jgi:inward rectifier potassium channel
MVRRRVQPEVPGLTGALRGTGNIRVKPLGSALWHPSDVYHQLIKLSWPRLAAAFTVLFLSFNLLFAFLYSLDPTGIAWSGNPIHAASFWRAFFFSIDTVATIGYGNMYPLSVYTNVLVVIEITCGILFFALVTGISFARFSRPTARVLFSNVAVIAQVDGVPALMFRAANQRHNLVFEARATVSLLMDELVDGKIFRRFSDLTLERSSTPVFVLTWTVMHRIGPDSPLAPYLRDQQLPADAEIVVVLSGTDEGSGQTIHSRWAYRSGDIRWNAHFVDIIGSLPDGGRSIDYRLFHAVDGGASAAQMEPGDQGLKSE